MNIRIVSTVLSLSCTVLATPLSAQPLQPVDRWHVDYGATQCTAARSFGAGSDAVTFGIVPSISGSSYDLLVSSPRPGPRYARETRGTVDLGGARISASGLYYGGAGVNMNVHRFRISAADMERVRSDGVIGLSSDDGARYSFMVSDVPALLDTLQQCTAGLQRYWNTAAGQTAGRQVTPLGDVAAVLGASDYRTQALVTRQRVPAKYQLLIDERGRVARCDVLASSGVAELDAGGCERISEVSRFSPAKDSNGRPVRSAWTSPPLLWTTGGSDAFASACTAMAGNYPIVLNKCGGGDLRPMQIVPAPPPPPSPAPVPTSGT